MVHAVVGLRRQPRPAVLDRRHDGVADPG
uniref:Uncharacterized protein n=1 Tax=Arundo donax TaxID=35708 RepID=A0A0A8ZVV8_ARUDO